MKKRYKILLGIFLFILISLSIGYYWLINGWKKYISEKELSAYASEIKKNPPLSDEFKELYYKLHPKEKDATLTGELLERISIILFTNNSRSPKQNCSCDDIFHYDWSFTMNLKKNKSRHDIFKYVKLGYGLEKFLTNEECLNYSIRLQYNEINRTGMGYSYEGKKFDELKREDIIDFFIAEKAWLYYSPYQNPERYNERKKMIMEIINKN